MNVINNIRDFLSNKGTPVKKNSLQAQMIPTQVKVSVPKVETITPQEKIAKIRLKNRIKAIKAKSNL